MTQTQYCNFKRNPKLCTPTQYLFGNSKVCIGEYILKGRIRRWHRKNCGESRIDREEKLKVCDRF